MEVNTRYAVMNEDVLIAIFWEVKGLGKTFIASGKKVDFSKNLDVVNLETDENVEDEEIVEYMFKIISDLQEI